MRKKQGNVFLKNNSQANETIALFFNINIKFPDSCENVFFLKKRTL